MGTNLQAFYKHFYTPVKTQKQQLHLVKKKLNSIFFFFKFGQGARQYRQGAAPSEICLAGTLYHVWGMRVFRVFDGVRESPPTSVDCGVFVGGAALVADRRLALCGAAGELCRGGGCWETCNVVLDLCITFACVNMF